MVLDVYTFCWAVYRSWFCVFGDYLVDAFKPYCLWGTGIGGKYTVIVWVSFLVIWFLGKWTILVLKNKDIDSEE